MNEIRRRIRRIKRMFPLVELMFLFVLILFFKIGEYDVCQKEIPKSLPSSSSSVKGSCISPDCVETRHLVDSINSSADPCDDFFEFACGGWIAKNPIPPKYSHWSQFSKLTAESNKVTGDILVEPAETSDPFALKQAKEFYLACVDLEELDRVGLNPILLLLEEYGGWPMIRPGWSPESFDWMKSTADLKRLFGTSAFFGISIHQYTTNPDFNSIYLSQPSLHLSRPYLLDHEQYSGYIEAYKELVIDTANKLATAKGITLDQTELSDSAEDLIFFESTLAELTKDKVTVQYGMKNVEYFSVYEFQEIIDNYTLTNGIEGVDLKTLLEHTFQSSRVEISEAQLLLVEDPDFIKSTLQLISNTRRQTVSNYIHFRMLEKIMPETATRETERTSREYNCASSVQQMFGLALSRPYIERKGITYEEYSLVVKMINDVRRSFLSLLDGLEWMDSNIKKQLREKAADSIKACVGFAPWMFPSNSACSDLYEQKLGEHFNGLDLGEESYLEKVWRVQRWETDRKFNQLNEPFTPGCDWTSFIGEVNAYYYPERETIYFPLGILQQPFLNAHESFASVSMGGFGSIIVGHELTHGFSVNGWTEKEDGSFTPLSQCLVDQFNEFRVISGLNVNGALSLDENFADTAGLMAAYKAYQRSSVSELGVIPGFEGFTQDQLFFLGYANTRCSASSPEFLTDIILDDGHAPSRFRIVGTLQNTKEFSDAWNCPVGSNMNPRGRTRCSVF